MEHIKNVINLKNLDFDDINEDAIAEHIVAALPFFNNNLEDIHVVLNQPVSSKKPGVVLEFSYLDNYFNKNLNGSKKISEIVNNLLKNKKKIAPDNSRVEKFLDFYKAYHDGGINKPESIAKLISDALPHFDNDLSKLKITLPSGLSYNNAGVIERFTLYTDYSSEFQEVKPFLTQNLNKPTLIKFNFDKESGSILETQGFGSNHIHHQIANLSNQPEQLNDFLNEVKFALDDLIKQLPENIADIKSVVMFDYHGEKSTLIARPLLSLLNKINHEDILNHALINYPQIKEYYDLNSNFYQEDSMSYKILSNRETPLWAIQLNQYNNDKKIKFLKVFYQNGVMHDKDPNLNKEQFYAYYLDIFKEAIAQQDISFIKKELESGKAQEVMFFHKDPAHPLHGKDLYNQPTFLSYNFEITKILKENNFPFFMLTNGVNSKYTILENSYVEEELKKIISGQESSLDINHLNPFSCFYDTRSNFYERLGQLCELFPSFAHPDIIGKYTNAILANTNEKDLSALFKNYPQLDFSKVDVFSFIFAKNCYEPSVYKDAIDAGVDPRICAAFISKVVQSRDVGLKLLKDLNKEGIIVAKNADYIFHVLHNNPTKTFLAYFDKTNNDVFNKFTYEQNPVWWGCESSEQLKLKLSKVENITQNAKDGRSIFHYYAKKEYLHPRQLSVDAILKTIGSSQHNFEENKFDLNYVDPKNGNNLLHELFTYSTFKTSLTTSVLQGLEQISENGILNMLYQTNSNNNTPLDLLFSDPNSLSKPLMTNKSSVALSLFNQFKEKIDYGFPMFDGTLLIDKIKPLLGKEEQLVIEEFYLNQTTPVNFEKKKSFSKF